MTLEVKDIRLIRRLLTDKGLIYEYSGYVKSESKPNHYYHTLVAIHATPYPSYKLLRYSCECEAFTYRGWICKHIKTLYNKAINEIKRRFSEDYKHELELKQIIERMKEPKQFSLEL
jgi:hypothetical protein